MPLPSDTRQIPLTLSHFEQLRRDANWQIEEIYLQTFVASLDPLAQIGGSQGGRIHYVAKATGRDDYPYLLFGPYLGRVSETPWPSKTEVDAFFASFSLSGNAHNEATGAGGLPGP